MQTYFSLSTGSTINYNIMQSAYILLPSISSQSNLLTEKSIMVPSNIFSQKEEEEHDLLSTASQLNEEVEILFQVFQRVTDRPTMETCAVQLNSKVQAQRTKEVRVFISSSFNCNSWSNEKTLSKNCFFFAFRCPLRSCGLAHTFLNGQHILVLFFQFMSEYAVLIFPLHDFQCTSSRFTRLCASFWI